MASRLRYWMVVAAACALTVVFVQTRQKRRWDFVERSKSPTRDSLMAVTREATKLMMEHRRYVIEDSLLSQLPQQPGLVFRQPANTVEDSVSVRKLVEEELGAGLTNKARIGVFIVPQRFGVYRNPTYSGPAQREVFAGADERGPYCAMVYTVRGMRDDVPRIETGVVLKALHTDMNDRERTDLAGPCAFYARYGAPGAKLDEWSKKSGYQFAGSDAHILTHALEDRQRDDPFGGDNLFSGAGHSSPDGEACRASHQDRCIIAVTGASAGPAPGSGGIPLGHFFEEDYGRFGRYDKALLAEMEHEFGAERFGKFWRSSESVEAAFQSAFGLSLGEWTQKWSQKYYGEATLGARIPILDVLLALLFCGVFVGVCFVIAQRRQVA